MCMSITDYIQAFAALISAAIAFIVWWQGRKMKHQQEQLNRLTDIVGELQAQTTIFGAMLDHDRMRSQFEVQPFFRPHTMETDSSGKYLIIKIKNEGQPFKTLDFENSTDNIERFKAVEKMPGKMAVSAVWVFFKPGEEKDNFAFDITTVDIAGKKRTQRFQKNKGADQVIHPPVSIG